MMSSRSVYQGWCGYVVMLVLFGLLESMVTAFNSSITNHASSSLSAQSTTQITNTTTTYSVIITPSLTTPNMTSTQADHGIRTTIRASFTTDATRPSISPNTTSPPPKRRPFLPTNKLSSFGIVMLAIGGILIVGMIAALLVICCRGRERGPEGPHVPHSNVKMKPWKSSELSTANELTEDTVEVPDKANHSQSHRNSGITISPQTSPALSIPPTNNNVLSTPTGSFRNLQTHSPAGDLGEFGRKLSLGRQAYEKPATPDEKPTECEPATEAKGEQDDINTVHYV